MKRLWIAAVVLALAACSHSQSSFVPHASSNGGSGELQTASSALSSACTIAPGSAGAFAGNVGGVSSRDAWDIAGNPMRFAHFNGSRWLPVAAPTIPNEESFTRIDLLGVVAIASNDVWTSGTASNATSTFAFFLHWDGTAWSYVPGFITLGKGARIVAIEGSASNNVWAIAQATNPTGAILLPERWDGTKWTAGLAIGGALPYNGIGSQMEVFGPNDVWMMLPNFFHAIIAHWNGRTITRTAGLPLNSNNSHLNFFGGTADDDLWYDAAYGGSFLPYIAHQSSTWASYSTSAINGYGLRSIVAFRRGYALINAIDPNGNPALLVYNGFVRWRPTASPFPGRASVISSSAIKGTTSFLASYQFIDGTGDAVLVQCPSTPPAPI